MTILESFSYHGSTAKGPERSFSEVTASAGCRLLRSISIAQQEEKDTKKICVLLHILTATFFPRATPLEVEQDVKNNLEKCKKNKIK